MTVRLTQEEKETIITFDEAGPLAHIFTYNRVWQKHLEKKLSLKPVMDNGHGGREYEISKKRIKVPRAPKKLSSEARAKAGERMRKIQKKQHQNKAAVHKSDTKKKSATNTINQQL